MPKLLKMTNQDNEFAGYLFWCPGCKECHSFDKRWDFDGNMENPTFKPSLLVNANTPSLGKRCHLFVRKGKIEFLADCHHSLAGQTVDMNKDDW